MLPPSCHSIEVLESRIAPAGLVLAAFDAATGTLTLTGSAMDDIVAVFNTGPNSYRVEGTGTDIDVAMQTFKDFTGKLNSVLINADAGLDSFSLRNLFTLTDVTFNGGAGDDSLDLINVSTKAGVTVNFDADGGSFFLGGNSSIGGDLVVNYGAGGGMAAVSGTAATIKGAVVLNGGAGADSFVVSSDAAVLGKGVKFTAGNGINEMIFSGVAATVGKGATGNAIEFIGGADANELTVGNVALTAKGNVAFTGGADMDTFDLSPAFLKLDGAVTANLAGAADAVFISPAIGSIKGAVNLNVGEGDGNTVRIAPINLTFGSSLSVTGGALADSFLVVDAASVSIKGSVTVDLGDGSAVSSNTVELSSSKLAIGGGLTIKGTPTSELTLNSIADALSIKGVLDVEPFASVTMNLDATQTSLGGLTVKGGTGADTVEISGAKLSVAGPVSVETGADVDTVSVLVRSMDIKGSVTIATGASADIVTVMGDGSVKGDVSIDLGAGDDGVSLLDIVGNSGIAGNLKLGGKLTINSAATDPGMLLGTFEQITLRDLTVAKTIDITLGDIASNVIIDNLIAKDVFTLNTGDGNDDVEIEQGTVFGPSVFSKMVTINLGDDNDTFRAGISSAIGSSSFARFLGILSVDAGAGTDGSNDFLNTSTNFFAPGILGASLRSNFEGPFI